MLGVASEDTGYAVPVAMVGAATLGLAALAAGVPVFAPAGLVAGGAIAIALLGLRRQPALVVALAVPAIALAVAIAAGAIAPLYVVALVALAAGSFAGHPAVFALLVVTSLPIVLIGWGMPPVYLAGWGYAWLVRAGFRAAASPRLSAA